MYHILYCQKLYFPGQCLSNNISLVNFCLYWCNVNNRINSRNCNVIIVRISCYRFECVKTPYNCNSTRVCFTVAKQYIFGKSFNVRIHSSQLYVIGYVPWDIWKLDDVFEQTHVNVRGRFWVLIQEFKIYGEIFLYCYIHSLAW